MKIVFTAVLTLFLSVFLYAQEIVAQENPAGLPQEVSSSWQEAEQTAPIAKDAESLEEFLKKQEELWLKEKGENTNTEHIRLSAPSVLQEDTPVISVQDNQPPAVSNKPQNVKQEETTLKPAQKVNSKTINKKPAETEEYSSSAQTEENAQLPQELPVNETPEQSNWPAFFKGLAFTLLLGAVVWLLCKYQ